MIETAAQIYRQILVAWIDAVRKRAAVVAGAGIILAIAAAVYVAGNVKINTDTSDMLSPDLPFRQNSIKLSSAFPQNSDNILIVIDGDNPDIADDAASTLAAHLSKNTALFGEVFYPEGDPFFRKNGLLYLKSDELSDLTNKLAQAQPLLGTLWRDPSLRGLFDVLGLAMSESTKQSDASGLELARVFDMMATTVEAQADGRRGSLSWQELMAGKTGDANDRRRLVVVQPRLDFGSLQPAAKAISEIRHLAKQLHLDGEHGVRVRLTGSAPLAEEELKSVVDGLGIAGVLSFVLVIGLLFWGLKSTRMVIATLITLIVGLIWTAAFAVAAVTALNLISVAFAVLFIGLSVDFGIHFCLRYDEDIRAGMTHDRALGEAAAGVGGALGLSALAAAIGFFSFLPTDYIGLAELGLIAGAGMFIALFANLTILPALLTVIPPKRRADALAAPKAPFLSVFRRNGRRVVAGAVLVAIASAIAAPRVHFDFDPLNLRDPKTESVSTLFDIMGDARAGTYTITILAKNLAAADALAKRIARLDTVDGTGTLSDVLPKNQEQKLETIGSAALFLAPAFMASGRDPAPDDAALLAAYEKFRADLAKYLSEADSKATAGARRLQAALAHLGAHPSAALLHRLQDRLLSSLPRRLETLRDSLDPQPVTLKTLPREIVDREIASDGRARLKVYPKESMRDRAAIKRFVTSVRTVAPDATGAPVIIYEAGRAVIRAFIEAGAISVVAISILLIVLMRRLREVLLVFAPLLLAALMTVAASVVLDLPFNFANVIVLPLLFGLGVAGNIHIVMRERDQVGAGDVLSTSTPRAVVFSALTTIGSFGSIALSSHPGTASMGILLTIAITLTLGTALIVLPGLLDVWPAKTKPAARAGKAS